jgi:hypothetical protein
MPAKHNATKGVSRTTRSVVFISKATPEDDDFVLWLAPRLEAAGYIVFADILSIDPGDRWRKEITDTLQNKAVKMLLCCRDATLNKTGVQEEIGIASDLVKELKDPRFIIPLRLAPFKKVFGIGELQWVDFLGSWANGLNDLLNKLKKQKVPRAARPRINPNWENYRKRLAIKVEKTPEVLTSNWLRVASLPDTIRYYSPPGAIDDFDLIVKACRESASPAEVYQRGFFSFAAPEEIARVFADVGPFEIQSEYKLLDFIDCGGKSPDIEPREAKNRVFTMFRRAWENFCRSKGLYEHLFAAQTAFHIGEAQAPLGKRIPWGQKDKRRSSMLRNSAGGRVWQYGVSATPAFWPYLHFKLKARVLFAELSSGKAGAVIGDTATQHRLRRTICKGWRNKQWHGRLMAYLELLSADAPCIAVPLAEACAIMLDAGPMRFTSPVTTALPDTMDADAEETDDSTLGLLNAEDEETDGPA